MISGGSRTRQSNLVLNFLGLLLGFRLMSGRLRNLIRLLTCMCTANGVDHSLVGVLALWLTYRYVEAGTPSELRKQLLPSVPNDVVTAIDSYKLVQHELGEHGDGGHIPSRVTSYGSGERSEMTARGTSMFRFRASLERCRKYCVMRAPSQAAEKI